MKEQTTILNRLFKRIISIIKKRWYALWHEKAYRRNGVKIRYIYKKISGSDTIIVSFPACSPRGAQYNWFGKLKYYECDQLFLLDNFAPNGRGCYFVQSDVEKCLLSFLHNICAPKKDIYFIGSSKGGYSALYFSFSLPNVTAIIGAPQYFLGDYLNRGGFIPNLEFILGKDPGQKEILMLNNKLKNLINTSLIIPKSVYLHFSKEEPTYENHIRGMLSDLMGRGIKVITDIVPYKEHEDVAIYYPLFLNKVLDAKILGKE